MSDDLSTLPGTVLERRTEMKDWMYYEKIQELKRNKLNKTQPSQQLGIDRKESQKQL